MIESLNATHLTGSLQGAVSSLAASQQVHRRLSRYWNRI